MRTINLNLDLIATFAWSDELGVKLRAIRESLGLSREQLSKKTEAIAKKVSVQYIRQLETPYMYVGTDRHSKNPTVSKDILVSICQALNIEIEALLS